MAAILKNKVASSLNKGHPSTFYSRDKQNPVLTALDQEITQFVAYMKKRSAPGFKIPDGEAYSRPADTLFELWNKYEPRLPKIYYQEKLLEMGDFLVSIEEYKLALWQCYERYLQHFGEVNVEEITDVDIFRQTFFPGGFDAENAGLTFRALMGKSISMYQVVRLSDPKLQNKQSVERCVQILGFLRLVMQVVLPRESLCWLIFNGTVHIYSMSRHLMSMGHSSRVLEFLLWAAMCMETSVPLMAVKYLCWRATLYTAVCQCYYDCKAGQHAEAFARRGLAKINELSQLEHLSNSVETPMSEFAFRQATVRMAVMVYKRSVFETRRKPKGLLRPKTRANLKDAMNMPWPRTPTEKMLADMFEGGSAQILAILESLTDSNRRILLTSPPTLDNEPEILDVYAELFMAAQEILAGGGGNRATATKTQMQLGSPPLSAVVAGTSLIDMATRGEEGVPLDCAIRIVKLAYNFEHWDVFDALVEPVLAHIKDGQGEQLAWEEKAIELLQAMGRLNSSRRHSKRAANAASTTEGEQEDNTEQINPNTAQSSEVARSTGVSTRSMIGQDDLINLADVLMSIVNGPFQRDKIEVDMVVDAALYLWSKCKAIFQKFQTGSIDNPRYLQKMDNPHKWMYLLDSVHQALGWTGISSVDPTLTAEVVLRLAMVYESSAQLETMDESRSPRSKMDREETQAMEAGGQPSRGPSHTPREAKLALKESKTTMTDVGGPAGGGDVDASHVSLLSQSSRQIARQQLAQARDILCLGLDNVNYARTAVALNDGKSIADISWNKRVIEDNESDSGDLNPDIFQVDSGRGEAQTGGEAVEEVTAVNPDDLIPPNMKGSATAVWNTVKDLHLELILMYHRVTLKLANLAAPGPDKGKTTRKRESVKQNEKRAGGADYIESFEELKESCERNLLSKALLFMQRALMLGVDATPNEQQQTLLNEAMGFIQRAEVEEERTYFENSGCGEQLPTECHVPPPPVLLCRTDRSMVFRPAPFIPLSGQKVAWYRIFGRNAAGSNVKARLSDYNLPGTGDEVPSYGCELKVAGLNPNERYVFAVAAYTADGTLIGNSIGETSKPILASHPLPVLMTWAFLSQISYQVGHYPTARKASEVLWDHFLAQPPPPEGMTVITEAKRDFTLTLLKLNQRAVCLSSPVLLRQFLTSIFINVDISARQHRLFCDVLTDQGPLYGGQMKRLGQCEKMLVAVELAGWLNEANLALQAVVQCYGLMAPLLFYKIPALPVIQILQHCHAVLQEIPSGLIQKRPGHVTESLHHMTACITYHLAKVLRTWGQKTLANSISEAGRRLLAMDSSAQDTHRQDADKEAGAPDSVVETDTGSMTLAALKRKKGGTIGVGGSRSRAGKEDDSGSGVNEELRALEAHMMKVTRAAHGEHELNGNEDPSILHAYIAYLPSKLAYREVCKFRRRARYLEFLVHVAQKGLTEGEVTQVVDWCEETDNWLAKRNESIIGPRAYVSKQIGAITVAGDDPKKFAAAVAEYSKKDGPSPRAAKDQTGGGGGGGGGGGKTGKSSQTPKGKGKKPKYKPLGVTTTMNEAQKQAQEQKELRSLEVLGIFFVDMYHNNIRKRRLRRITADEMPWRSQLHMVQGLSQFGAFLQKLETREKLLGSSSSNMYRTSFLDHEWFTFETAGTLVVGWDGGPVRRPSARNMATTRREEDVEEEKRRRNVQALDLAVEERPRTTGIEFAAAAATGAAPPPMFPIPPEIEDTPRTYRSDMSKIDSNRVDPESLPLSTTATIQALTKTFNFFKRSVVLAHRGQHWTLLQNGARALWNCLHTAMLRALTLAPEGEEPGLLTMARLNQLAWQPVHMATDCLLDMLMYQETELKQQAAKARSRGHQLGGYFKSWMGSIMEERGGSSLKFEEPLDDQSCVDMRWVRRLVLRCLEMLYYQQKWEKLIDIALRFSALSNDRYAEQVVPLLVQAQRKVEARIAAVGGPKVPQPHFREVKAQLGRLMTARDYLTTQLKMHFDPARYNLIQPGAQIDPVGHNTYSEEDAFRLSSVPLDTSLSLETLRGILLQSRYTARALQHSRQMLVLYLAGQQNSGVDNLLSRQPTKVDFVPNTARPQPTSPPDLSHEEFQSADDVQTSPIPRSQLGHVIISYEKTIEMLLAKNQKGLSAQAMQELGNIHYHANNIRAAYRCWADSLDIVLGMTDALRMWRRQCQGQEDISAWLLERCGLWGCVMAGVLASNIAQYILTADLGRRMECCFLSGYLFKSLFRASLPHPTSDRDYALYDVGEGCEVTNLVPGFDFMSDRFRCNGRALVAALRWVTEELARGRHNLFVLPLLSLYQYFTTFVCRDVQRTVDGRILKVRVLTDLGLFSEALTVLQRLLHGERLPHTGDSSFRQTESRIGNLRFNTSHPINDLNNLKVLENILDKRLSSHLATLFGPHLTCHLSLAQSHLFVALAETIPVLPAMEDVIFAVDGDTLGVKPRTIPTMSRGGLGSKGPKLIPGMGSSSRMTSEDKKDGDSDDISAMVAQRFTDSKKVPTLELIKGTLLLIADQMVTTISEVICDNTTHDKIGLPGLSAAELELVVLCRLEQASISLQKHHAPMAARTILSALRLLHDSHIFQPKKPAPPPPREDATLYERPSSMKGNNTTRKVAAEVRLVDVDSNQFQYQNFQSRARLDARLWLTCRMALVRTLNMEIRGMGEVKGADNKVLTELAECRQYCVEGLKEAEACGDVEAQAEFLVQGALLNIMEGRNLEQTVSILDDAARLLNSVSCLSMPAEELLATCHILKTDLEATIPTDVPSDTPTQRTLQAYLLAQDIILQQMEALGERIEHHLPRGQLRHLSVPVSPMENIYTIQVLRLAQLKLRIGHAMARNLARDIRNGQIEEGPLLQWVECLGVLSTALEIMQVSMRREASAEAEILLAMGKIQKMLVYQGKYQARAAASTLLDAIKVSFANDHDLGLIRQAYLEMALVYLYSCGPVQMKKEGSLMESGTWDSGDESATSTKSSSVREKKRWKGKKERSITKAKEEETEVEKDRRAAWVAIRCAAATAQAMRARGMMIGDTNITMQKVMEKSHRPMPDFAALDMMNPYVLGEKKKVFKNEIEEELAPLIEAQEVKVQETYEDQVTKARAAATDLSFIHILGYQTILQRLCCTSTVASSSSPPDGVRDSEHGGENSSDFDLGFISHVQFDMGQNFDVVRYMLFSGPWSIRLNHLHQYLCSTLPQYANDCCAIYPPSILLSLATMATGIASDLNITIKSYASNLSLNSLAELESSTSASVESVPKAPPPPGSTPDPHKPSDKHVVSSNDSEVATQWYQPTLEEADPARPELNPADRRIILLYALSRKGTSTQSNIFPGYLWVSLHKINDLHDRLSVLAQRGEISLVEKAKKETQAGPSPTSTKPKKAQRIKALSPKMQRDEQLENLLRQCMDDIASLMGCLPEQGATASTEIPFEVSKGNLKSLEQLFDPSLGMVLRGTDLAPWMYKLFP